MIKNLDTLPLYFSVYIFEKTFNILIVSIFEDYYHFKIEINTLLILEIDIVNYTINRRETTIRVECLFHYFDMNLVPVFKNAITNYKWFLFHILFSK